MGVLFIASLASHWFPSDGHGFSFTYVSIVLLTDLVELKWLFLYLIDSLLFILSISKDQEVQIKMY